FADDLGVLADEDRVLLHMHDDVEIAGRTAALTRLAFAGQLEPRAGVDAGRHFDGQHTFRLDLARAAAGRARIGDDLPGALAVTARARDLEEPLRHPQLTRAVAGGARLGAGAGFRARAVAGRALLVPRDLDLGLAAERGLGEADLEVVAEVAPALLAAPRAAALPEDLA